MFEPCWTLLVWDVVLADQLADQLVANMGVTQVEPVGKHTTRDVQTSTD